MIGFSTLFSFVPRFYEKGHLERSGADNFVYQGPRGTRAKQYRPAQVGELLNQPKAEYHAVGGLSVKSVEELRFEDYLNNDEVRATHKKDNAFLCGMELVGC